MARAFVPKSWSYRFLRFALSLGVVAVVVAPSGVAQDRDKKEAKKQDAKKETSKKAEPKKPRGFLDRVERI